MPDVLVFSATVPKLVGAKVILDLHDPMPELMQTIFRLPENSLSVVALKRLEQWSIRFRGSRSDGESRVQEDLLFPQLSAA